MTLQSSAVAPGQDFVPPILLTPSVPPPAVGTQQRLAPTFNVSRHINLVPQFRESEVKSYFPAFERSASVLHWPKDVWPLLLQCKLEGKAQEVCAALTLDQNLDYDIVKSTVLRAYELVPTRSLPPMF